jgi:anti-sigma B factor antagonist
LADELLLDVLVRPVGNGVALATVGGEIDIATVSSLRGALSPLVANPAVRLLVCDLSVVSFLGCAGVSVLLEMRAALMARGARLRVVANGNIVLRPLTVLSLLETLQVRPDLWSAMG